MLEIRWSRQGDGLFYDVINQFLWLSQETVSLFIYEFPRNGFKSVVEAHRKQTSIDVQDCLSPTSRLRFFHQTKRRAFRFHEWILVLSSRCSSAWYITLLKISRTEERKRDINRLMTLTFRQNQRRKLSSSEFQFGMSSQEWILGSSVLVASSKSCSADL